MEILTMTDLQFEILDELYFVISFDEIKSKLDMDESILLEELQKLVEKEWVKCFKKNIDLSFEEISKDLLDYKSYQFLASKKGLFAHNSR